MGGLYSVDASHMELPSMREPYRPPPKPLMAFLMEAIRVIILCALLVALNELIRPYYCAHVTRKADGFPAFVCGN